MATATATHKRMFIDGKWCDSDSGRTLKVINPATEEVLAEIAYGGRAEVKRAIEAAHRAMPSWMKQTANDRAKVLKKTADLAPTFTRVAQELHAQYVMGFTPTQLDGKVHKLSVRIKKPGMTARARRSYVAALDKYTPSSKP